MARRASPLQMVEQVDDLVKTLKVARQVIPVLAEQARLELHELSGGLPTSERGADYSLDPPPYYNDPTGEQVIHHRPAADGDCRPVEDLERIARWIGDVQHLVGSTRKMLNQAPAVTLSVVDGRKPTDGRSAEEHAQRKFVRALSGERCIVAVDHADEDRFGPGQLRRGMCDRHRKAFERWCASQPVLPIEAADRLARWQTATFGHPTEVERPDESGPYKNLKDVA